MLHKPHWTYGLELGAHHFQALDRYHEDLIARRLEMLCDHPWGIFDIQWDARGIGAGHVSLLKVDAVLPDGTPIVCETTEGSTAPSLTVRDLGKATSLEVYLGIRRDRSLANGHANGANGDGGAQGRYAVESTLTADYAAGGDPVRLEWLRPNVRLLLQGEALQDFVTLPCARIIRSTAGQLAFDETFVPPLLSIGASPYVQTELRQVLEDLTSRQATLRRSAPRDATEAVQRWLSSVVGAFVPRVADLLHQRHAHPLVVYRLLAELIGSLAPFTREGDFRVPAFEHDHLGRVFREMFATLAVLLDALGAEHHRRIPLVRYDAMTLFADLKEPTIFRNDFYLGVKGNDQDTLRAHVPRHFKVAAWNDLSEVVRTATAGVLLEHDPRPPVTLPSSDGTQYFKLSKTDAFSPILKTGQIGIHYVAGLPFTDVSLFAVDPAAP